MEVNSIFFSVFIYLVCFVAIPAILRIFFPLALSSEITPNMLKESYGCQRSNLGHPAKDKYCIPLLSHWPLV